MHRRLHAARGVRERGPGDADGDRAIHADGAGPYRVDGHIEDPNTWARPWTIAMPLTADAHPIYAFDCHEHNYGLVNILRAARAEDAASERPGPASPAR